MTINTRFSYICNLKHLANTNCFAVTKYYIGITELTNYFDILTFLTIIQLYFKFPIKLDLNII